MNGFNFGATKRKKMSDRLLDVKTELLKDYLVRFSALEDIAYKLHGLDETEIEMQVLRKMAGLRLLIDHLKNDMA